MKTENNSIIFTVLNKKLITISGILTLLSFIIVILFFTIIDAEYIILGLPFVFFLFVLPIFMIGMRNKIIYRFTIDELQFRGENRCKIKWADIAEYSIDNTNIVLQLKNGTVLTLPILDFNPNELHKVLSTYIQNK